MADIKEQIYYQGKETGKPGTLLAGFIVSCESNTDSARFQIRVPAIHGYCDLDENNSESDSVTKNIALPWAAIPAQGFPGLTNNNVQSYYKGDFVVVRFDGPNFTNPVIISKSARANATYAAKDTFTADARSKLLDPVFVKTLNNNYSVTGASSKNGCTQVIVNADESDSNGTSVPGADKCGQNGRIKDGFAANIADFLKIIQETDGKVGSKFVSKYTGELFEMTAYVQKYVASIQGVFRSGIGGIKAIITKYARKAIDKLVKRIMKPIKKITKKVHDVFEKVLNKIACSFGNLDALIQNLLESLLNSLLDGALNAVFGCLDSLLDGILNEILSEALNLINSIMSSISAIAGLIGGFGDLAGEAVNAILDFLGISCGGAGDCTVSGEKSFTDKFNTPGEYGFPNGLKRKLNLGLNSINNLSGGIDKSTAAANKEAADYAKGVDLGTSKGPGISSDNPALTSAFTTATNLLGNSVSNTITGFCNSLTPPTTAIVVGSPITKYDSMYSVFATSTSVATGGTQTFKIYRNNALGKGVINFVAYLASGDTARVVGITPGLTTGGDLNKDISLSPTDFCQDITNTSRGLPINGNVIVSKKLIFEIGVKELLVSIPSNVNTPPTSTTEEVQYSVGVFRCTDDLNTTIYSGLNTPSLSDTFNTTEGIITFSIESEIIPEDPVVFPPSLITGDLTYSSSNISIVAGDDASFIITRTPVDAEYSRIKCETIDDTAISGVDYTGGSALIEFPPYTASAIFAVKTTTIPGLTNTIKNFKLKITDETIPSDLSSNLGGVSTSTGATSIGSGLIYNATLNYGLTPNTTTTSGMPNGTGIPSGTTGTSPIVPLCTPEIIITSQPPSCIVQPDVIPLTIGLIAKTTVPGYTLNYQWQKTYSPSSGWTNVFTGLFNKTINVKKTSFGALNTVTISGVVITLSGWSTSIVPSGASITYSGATSPALTINPLSYLINDEEYYRCVISGIPIVVTSGSPAISVISESTYVGVTSSGVFLSSVNCSPTIPSGGSVIVYSGTTPNVGSAVLTNAVTCRTPIFPIPLTDTTTTTTPIPSGITTTIDVPVSVPSGIAIIPVPSPDPNDIPIIIPIVDPNGGIVSIPVPEGLPFYKYPPLIPITGTGVGATTRAELDENGRLIKIVVKNKGFGYSPTITTLCGILDSIELINPGAYYKSSPTVYVNGDSSIASAAIDEIGRVIEIRITNPKEAVFDKIPRIDIIGGEGFGAHGIAVIRHVDCANVANEYLNIINKYNTSKLGTVKVVDCP